MAVLEAERLKKKLGVVNPLDGVKAHTEECRCSDCTRMSC